MKKVSGFILLFLMVFMFSGCAYTDWTFQIKTTSFDTSEIKQKDNVIISKGKVKVHDSYGVVLAVEVSENTSGTFRIIYSKDKNTLDVLQNWNKILLLEEGTVSDIDSGEIVVELSKGLNEFVISGEDSICDYTATLDVTNKDSIVNYNGGYIMPHK